MSQALQARLVMALCIVLMFTVFLPNGSDAVDKQANMQCPAGGQVGQPCKDVTNGYTTSGHCTFIGICKADNFPMAPKGSEQNNPPTGSPTPGTPGGGSVKPGASGTSTEPLFAPPLDSDPSEWSPEEIIAAAYQRAQSIPSIDDNGTQIESYVKFLNFQGTTYLVTPSEILVVGSDLSPAPSGALGSSAIPSEFNTESFKSFAGLYPDLGSVTDPNAVDKRIYPDQRAADFGRSTFGDPRHGGGAVGTSLSALLDKVKSAIRSLSDEERTVYGLVAAGTSLLLMFVLYDRYFRRGRTGTIEPNKNDFEKLTHQLSDKDRSTASPVITAPQERVIWDPHEKK